MQEMQVISCIRFSMQILIAESVFFLGWKRRERFWLYLISGLVGYFCAAVCIFEILHRIPSQSPVILIAYYGGLFLVSIGFMKYCFPANFEEILFAGACGYATQHIAFAVTTAVTEGMALSLTGIWDFLWIRFLPYVITSGIVYVFIVGKNAGKGELKKKDIRMVGLSLMILFTVIILSVLVDHRIFRENSALLQNVFCKIYAVICCIFAISTAYNVSRQNRILHENEMMESMLHNMSEQQKLSQDAVNIINIKCHDLKYRLSQISKIADAREQKEYIEQVKGAISIYDNIFQTGNDALDLVLTEKSLLCNEYEIKMSCMVDGKLLEFLSSADVYALFGNLMDNAIESVMKETDTDKRIISILVAARNQGSFIHMENYCKEQVAFADGLPQTTKKDKHYHGFGVKSIRYIVDKYKGELLMRAEQERFVVDILFYPEKR